MSPIAWDMLGIGFGCGALLGMEVHRLLRWLRRYALNRAIKRWETKP